MSDFAKDTDVLISRQAAYETLAEYYHHKTEIQHEALREALGRVPAAQSQDTIDRQSTIETIHKAIYALFNDTEEPMTEKDKLLLTVNKAVSTAVRNLPASQPEYSMDEWCTDCKEYDHEKHCCPRFNRVIRETVAEVKENASEREIGKWIIAEDSGSARCSECGDKVFYLYNFCPNCGKKMGNSYSRNEEVV